MVGMAAISFFNHFRVGIIRAEPARQIAASQSLNPLFFSIHQRVGRARRIKLFARAQIAILVGL
jgi:hypothetical protein